MFQTLPDSLEPRSIVHSFGRPTGSYPKLTVSMQLPSFGSRTRSLMENPEFWWYKFGFQEDTQKMNHAGLFSVSNHIEIKAAALLLRSCA
ncbi:hypothetical protein T09_7567, partial [Trichinella sp. T9]